MLFRSVRTGRLRANLDLYNLLNASTVTSVNGTYGARWRFPTVLMNGRYIKIGAQIDF